MKNNLEHSALPTPDELRLYHEGKLGPMRSHEIELLAQENPLLAEALEGFATKPAYAMLPLIQAGILQASGGAIAGGAAGASGAALLKASTPWWHLNGWWIGVVTGTAAATGTAVVMEYSNEEKSEENASGKNVQTTEVIASSPSIGTTDTVHYQDGLEPSLTHVESNQIAVNTESVAENSEIASSRNSAEINTIQSVSGRDMTVSNASQTDAAIPEPKRTSTIAIGIIHVLNYKLADYTALRQNTWQKFSIDDVGVPAKFSNDEERKKYLSQNPDQAVPYVEYISQCIKAYDDNKFTLAIDRFAEVLKQYPDDVNALFYTGMSHYMSGNYTTSSDLFAKVEKNFINTFNEEALFYHGKSLKKLDRYEEAISYFAKVVKWNGFYKEQAIEEMQSED